MLLFFGGKWYSNKCIYLKQWLSCNKQLHFLIKNQEITPLKFFIQQHSIEQQYVSARYHISLDGCCTKLDILYFHVILILTYRWFYLLINDECQRNGTCKFMLIIKLHSLSNCKFMATIYEHFSSVFLHIYGNQNLHACLIYFHMTVTRISKNT